ncbi:MAG: hypothetical protein DMF61_01080 [Blastocatellia bacterium AA13]|nr:MAG: hypothetical protein DMF61_01080 [Blastocatellia bacterium AA13]
MISILILPYSVICYTLFRLEQAAFHAANIKQNATRAEAEEVRGRKYFYRVASAVEVEVGRLYCAGSQRPGSQRHGFAPK